MIVTTSAIQPEETKEILGIVSGTCVLSRAITSDLAATFRNTVGGEINTYSNLLQKAFDMALKRVVAKAKKSEATGIFGIQMACPEIAGGAAEIIVIGTAYR